jgi:uncharacterized protein (DUF302 family)
MAVPGLTTIKSSHPPHETMSRLEAAVKAKGLTVFARIDHAEAVIGKLSALLEDVAKTATAA